MDRPLILRSGFGRAAGAQVADRLRLDPLALGNRRMSRPLVMRFPVLRGHQDRKFRQPWRHFRSEPAVSAELLRQLAESGSVQIAVERTAHLELAARAGADRVDERTLLGRELVFRDGGQAGRGHLPGGHRFPRVALACSGGPRIHRLHIRLYTPSWGPRLEHQDSSPRTQATRKADRNPDYGV